MVPRKKFTVGLHRLHEVKNDRIIVTVYLHYGRYLNDGKKKLYLQILNAIVSFLTYSN